MKPGYTALALDRLVRQVGSNKQQHTDHVVSLSERVERAVYNGGELRMHRLFSGPAWRNPAPFMMGYTVLYVEA